ncbi:hypothetical protein VOLCADRAFT_103990 [Volvox carteri f. nagariensis]|uniref:Cyclic nucleotide-binding domain-containing protein n=1 Tax=Volvox carteri f. nagariensis TaxID=3068 RepID=D8TQI6_VOLCA|nr:uncharacterized protein VOLCADRAFT_103990 [Volvox carteri f. nagariensis]EFJ50040.1 hypothetical protein VOLCADRAFT_103990 [Volvox carteri f. nagariensis]|eukprot:XP_002948660.1 hypothetical protein VOLCADRAFT_103990 [Volvox carteri f. nagariensis]
MPTTKEAAAAAAVTAANDALAGQAAVAAQQAIFAKQAAAAAAQRAEFAYLAGLPPNRRTVAQNTRLAVFLGNAPRTQQAGPTALHALSTSVQVVEVARGGTVYRMNDQPDGFYVVVDGRIILYDVKDKDEAEEDDGVVERLGRLDCFGEEDLLSNSRRGHRADVGPDCSALLLRVPPELYRKYLQHLHQPDFEDKVEFLGQLEVFKSLPNETLRKLAPCFSQVVRGQVGGLARAWRWPCQELRAREYLVYQGERAESMYAIASGQCSVLVDSTYKPDQGEAAEADPKKAMQVCLIGPGNIVGDMTVLANVRRRTASILCLSDVICYKIRRATFVRRVPPMELEALRQVAEAKLRITERQLRSSVNGTAAGQPGSKAAASLRDKLLRGHDLRQLAANPVVPALELRGLAPALHNEAIENLITSSLATAAAVAAAAAASASGGGDGGGVSSMAPVVAPTAHMSSSATIAAATAAEARLRFGAVHPVIHSSPCYPVDKVRSSDINFSWGLGPGTMINSLLERPATAGADITLHRVYPEDAAAASAAAAAAAATTAAVQQDPGGGGSGGGGLNSLSALSGGGVGFPAQLPLPTPLLPSAAAAQLRPTSSRKHLQHTSLSHSRSRGSGAVFRGSSSSAATALSQPRWGWTSSPIETPSLPYTAPSSFGVTSNGVAFSVVGISVSGSDGPRTSNSGSGGGGGGAVSPRLNRGGVHSANQINRDALPYITGEKGLLASDASDVGRKSFSGGYAAAVPQHAGSLQRPGPLIIGAAAPPNMPPPQPPPQHVSQPGLSRPQSHDPMPGHPPSQAWSPQQPAPAWPTQSEQQQQQRQRSESGGGDTPGLASRISGDAAASGGAASPAVQDASWLPSSGPSGPNSPTRSLHGDASLPQDQRWANGRSVSRGRGGSHGNSRGGSISRGASAVFTSGEEDFGSDGESLTPSRRDAVRWTKSTGKARFSRHMVTQNSSVDAMVAEAIAAALANEMLMAHVRQAEETMARGTEEAEEGTGEGDGGGEGEVAGETAAEGGNLVPGEPAEGAGARGQGGKEGAGVEGGPAQARAEGVDGPGEGEEGSVPDGGRDGVDGGGGDETKRTAEGAEDGGDAEADATRIGEELEQAEGPAGTSGEEGPVQREDCAAADAGEAEPDAADGSVAPATETEAETEAAVVDAATAEAGASSRPAAKDAAEAGSAEGQSSRTDAERPAAGADTEADATPATAAAAGTKEEQTEAELEIGPDETGAVASDVEAGAAAPSDGEAPPETSSAAAVGCRSGGADVSADVPSHPALARQDSEVMSEGSAASGEGPSPPRQQQDSLAEGEDQPAGPSSETHSEPATLQNPPSMGTAHTGNAPAAPPRPMSSGAFSRATAAAAAAAGSEGQSPPQQPATPPAAHNQSQSAATTSASPRNVSRQPTTLQLVLPDSAGSFSNRPGSSLSPTRRPSTPPVAPRPYPYVGPFLSFKKTPQLPANLLASTAQGILPVGKLPSVGPRGSPMTPAAPVFAIAPVPLPVPTAVAVAAAAAGPTPGGMNGAPQAIPPVAATAAGQPVAVPHGELRQGRADGFRSLSAIMTNAGNGGGAGGFHAGGGSSGTRGQLRKGGTLYRSPNASVVL